MSNSVTMEVSVHQKGGSEIAEEARVNIKGPAVDEHALNRLEEAAAISPAHDATHRTTLTPSPVPLSGVKSRSLTPSCERLQSMLCELKLAQEELGQASSSLEAEWHEYDQATAAVREELTRTYGCSLCAANMPHEHPAPNPGEALADSAVQGDELNKIVEDLGDQLALAGDP